MVSEITAAPPVSEHSPSKMATSKTNCVPSTSDELVQAAATRPRVTPARVVTVLGMLAVLAVAAVSYEQGTGVL